MALVSRVASLVRNLLQRHRIDRDLDEEVRAYVEMRADEHCRAGLPPDEARRRALIESRGVERIKENVRDVRAGAMIEQCWQDLSYAARLLIKERRFAAAAILTLALGMGVNAALFTIVDTVVFRPLPYKDPAQLVKITRNAPAPADDMSLPDFIDIRDRNRVFQQAAADDGGGFTVVAGGARENVNGAIVTAQWLVTLGVQPILGRAFLVEEMQPGGTRVVILTHAYWQRRFAADPDVIGRSLSIDGRNATVIGVLPPNVLRYSADFVIPLVPAEYPADRGHRDLDVFARLRPGVTLAEAQADVDTIARSLQRDYPATNRNRTFSVVPLGKYYAAIQPKARYGLVVIFGAVALVLLIACVNVANLLLARAIARYRECVVRAALGASRGRLIRQLLVEHLLLFAAGGAAGLVLARWLLESLLVLAVGEGYVPAHMRVAVDGRVFGFGLLVSLGTGLFFGLGVAIRASRVDLSAGLRDASPTFTGDIRRNRIARLLIVAELVLCIVLLVGFSLLTRSFLRVQAAAGGFVPQNVLETGSDGGRSFGPAVEFWRAALAHARTVPGVEFVAVSSRPPIHGARQQPFTVEGRGAILEGDDARAGDILVSADYFKTMGIPVLQGRAFTEQDSASTTPVAVISQKLARRYFLDVSPIGRRLLVNEHSPMTCCTASGPVDGVWREIVGVVGDIRQGNLDEEPAATIYRPYSQIVEHDMYLMVRARSASDILSIASGLRAHLVAADPGKEWWDVRSMQQVIDGSESVRLRRFILILLGSFATLAVLLAGVGLYGVASYSVAERRREIGIRVALGATRAIILKDVMAESLSLSAAGVVIGCLVAYMLTRFISSMLFNVSPTDFATYGVVSFVLMSVALLAAYLPARRAAQVDPVTTLRQP